MEIIHVVLGKANPQRMNGVNKVVYQLAHQQVLAGKKAAIWGITKDPVHNYPERNFDTRLFKAYRNKFKVDRAFIEAVKQSSASAVFHLHGGFNPIFTSISKVLEQHQRSFVFTPHGAYNEIAMERSWIVKKIYGSLFEMPMLRRARKIHCLGKSEITGLTKILPQAPAILVPYGFELASSQKHFPPQNRFIIGFCGRLDIYTKGLDVLIPAFALVKKTIPDAELWIIGDGKERAHLEKIIEQTGVGDVMLLGSKYGEEKDQLLQQLHLFAHPSRNEGLPSAVLEAASFGIPCVITTATNIGDSVEQYDCGLVINDTDKAQLFHAMMEMYRKLNGPDANGIKSRSVQMVKELYNWNHIVHQFDKVYHSC